MTIATQTEPLISVVMANYCGAPYLAKAMESVLRQTHRRLELIVSDDASGDDSVACTRGIMARDPRVSVIEAPVNSGPAAARNRAIDAANGEWIALIDSDDLMHPRRIEAMLAAALRLQSDAVADDMIYFGNNAQVAGRTLMQDMQLTAPRRIDATTLVAANTGGSGLPPLGYLKPMIRRDALADLRYDEALRVGEDYDLYLRLLMADARFDLLPGAFYLYRRHSGSISHRLSETALNAMLRAHEVSMTAVPQDAHDLRLGMQRRRKRLRRGVRFERLVSALKRKQYARGFGLLAATPALAGPLMRSLTERANRVTPPAGENHRTKLTVVLASDDPVGLDLTQSAFAQWIALPRFGPPETIAAHSALWAQLSDLSARHDLHVIAVGTDGLFALGNMPPPLRVTIIDTMPSHPPSDTGAFHHV